MKSLLLVMAAGFSLFSCGIAAVPPPAGFAVVYGITKYNIVSNLSFTDDDAVAVAEMLSSKGYEVILRTDDGTKEQFLRDIEDVSLKIGPYDTFIFYFAGHGGRYVDFFGYYSDLPGNEPPLQDPEDEWIFLSGSLTTGNFEDWPDAAIKDDELGAILSTIPTKKKIVILDACNSGGFIHDDYVVDGIPADYGEERRAEDVFKNSLRLYAAPPKAGGVDVLPGEAIVFAAAGERENSLENAFIQHGIFTYFLLQTPAGADNNKDGFISLVEAYDYTARRLEIEWNDKISNPEYMYYPRISGAPYDIILFPAD